LTDAQDDLYEWNKSYGRIKHSWTTPISYDTDDPSPVSNPAIPAHQNIPQISDDDNHDVSYPETRGHDTLNA
jgi:hypothetical protein